MDLDPILLARLQFAFTIIFHIVFPTFTIGLSAYIATLCVMAMLRCARAASAIAVGYTIFVYWTFSGKLREGEGYH